ncbi:MAG: glycosyl hydrolase 2 galactose-binding domain-containing protein [Prevotella sp.]|jgi:hypothetical protein
MNWKSVLAVALTTVSMGASAAVGDTISLDEKWLFKFFPSQKSMPRNVQLPSYNDSQWGFQSIPAQWKVPSKLWKTNCWGVYRGWIKMPETFAGRRVFLHVGNATTVAHVYMNGKEIGQTASDKAQTEFEITNFLKPNRNARNLFVITMPRWQSADNQNERQGHSGIVSPCYLYALNSDGNPAPEYVPVKAGRSRVADRRSFEPDPGVMDSPQLMQSDIDMMKKMGFGAVTYSKPATDPQFIRLAQSNGLDVVSDTPETTLPFLDANRRVLPDAYAYLPESKFDFKGEIRNGEKLAMAAVAKPKPKKKEDNDIFSVWDTPYSIQFDKHTGMIQSYTLGGISVISSGGALMPNARHELVSFTAQKPNKNSGTKANAVIKIDGVQYTWDYFIAPSGVLTVKVSGGNQDILLAMASALSQSACLAKGFDGDEQLTNMKERRPGVLWLKQTNANGRGVEVVCDREFTVSPTTKASAKLIKYDGKTLELHFLPVVK